MSRSGRSDLPISRGVETPRWSWLLVVVAAGCLAGCPAQGPVDGTAAVKRPAGVRGYMVWSEKPRSPEGIRVPGIEVELREAGAVSVVAETVSDLSGRFEFTAQEPGEYELCWRGVGFAGGCLDEPVVIIHSTVYLPRVDIRPMQDNDHALLWGHVRLADGSLPRTIDPLANINAYATLRGADNEGEVTFSGVYVNNHGEYVAPYVPVESQSLLVEMEKLSFPVALTAAELPQGAARKLNIVVGNHRPIIEDMQAASNSGTSFFAMPGETITLSASATDRDGHATKVHWRLPNGDITPGSTRSYALSNEARGRLLFTAFASDGYGGYDRETLLVTIGGVRFGGVVVGNDTGRLADVEVSINGIETSTDKMGYFSVLVPEKPPYVVNLRREGYRLTSSVHDRGVGGGRWLMYRAHVEKASPEDDIAVQQPRDKSDCPGPLSARSPSLPGVHTDPRAAVAPRECGPGIAVKIPANSLVRQDGKPPAAGELLNVAVSTFDIQAPFGMPGDYTAADANGQIKTMESYGAGSVEVYDDEGRRYNLKPGARASVSLPIDEAQQASAKPTIPILFYDSARGVWDREPGLVATKQSDRYTTEVPHFSEINADALKDNQSCVRLDAAMLPPIFFLEALIPDEDGGEDRRVFQQVDNSARRFHALYNLPSNVDITITAFDVGADFNTPGPALVSFNGLGNDENSNPKIDTGTPQDPLLPNKPEFPYAACANTVQLVPPNVPSFVTDYFLSGTYIYRDDGEFDPKTIRSITAQEFEPTDDIVLFELDQRAQDYYDTIDRFSRRATLEAFIDVNDFSDDDASALYSNSADLGFGREMHCTENGDDVACYVTNYGFQETDDLEDFHSMLRHLEILPGKDFDDVPIATVAMEYSPIEIEQSTDPDTGETSYEHQLDEETGQPKRVVKFYVYLYDNGSNERVRNADLDGFGQRPVPELCMMCHGGTLPAADFVPGEPDTGNLHSSFLPFDLAGLLLPEVDVNGEIRDFKVDQQESFAKLNQLVVKTDPTPAIAELIDVLYDDDNAEQREDVWVPGWEEDKDFYRGTLARSCRACHTAIGNSFDQANYLWWQSPDDFLLPGGVRQEQMVCLYQAMPHALVTYRNFWLSLEPHQPLAFFDFLQARAGSDIGASCIGQGETQFPEIFD